MLAVKVGCPIISNKEKVFPTSQVTHNQQVIHVSNNDFSNNTIKF